jgi:hypothetical protein
MPLERCTQATRPQWGTSEIHREGQHPLVFNAELGKESHNQGEEIRQFRINLEEEAADHPRAAQRVSAIRPPNDRNDSCRVLGRQRRIQCPAGHWSSSRTTALRELGLFREGTKGRHWDTNGGESWRGEGSPGSRSSIPPPYHTSGLKGVRPGANNMPVTMWAESSR